MSDMSELPSSLETELKPDGEMFLVPELSASLGGKVMTSKPTLRLALSCEEITSMLSYCQCGTYGWEYRFEKLFNFLGDLARAPIYRDEMQIQVGGQDLALESAPATSRSTETDQESANTTEQS